MLDKRPFNKDRKDTKDVRRSRPPLDDVWDAVPGAAVLRLLFNYSHAQNKRMCRLRCSQRRS